MEHLNVVTAEELVPESGGGDNENAGLLDWADGDTEEDGEPREGDNFEGKEGVEDEEGGDEVVQLEADGKDTEDVVAGVTGVFE